MPEPRASAGDAVSARYRLASHVHACRAGTDLVLLDVRRDRYLGMDARDEPRLRALIAGLPQPGGDREAEAALPDRQVAPEAERVSPVDELIKLGMLAGTADGVRLTGTASIERPETALIEGYCEDRARIRFRDVACVMWAMLTAATLLRTRSLEQIVKRIERSRGARDCELDRMRQRLMAFERLRPIFYADGDACLFSSLAIREYLAREGMFPNFVLGVATRPFRAHCWLQHKDVVLNDMPENVREYAPILVV